MRIDELIQTLVVNTDFAPVSPPALGPGYKATLAQIVSAGLYQPNSSTAGAGANLTIKAADGVTSGAGGSVYITAGSQASTGGHGSILLSSAEIRWTPLSTSSMYLRIWDEGLYSGVGIATNNMNDYYISFHGTSGRIVRFRANMEVYTGVVFNSNTAFSNASGLTYGYTGVTRVTDSGNGGGSFAYTSNTPTALSANTDNLSLNGSAFQRLSSSSAVNLTGIAGTSDAYRGVSHIDGRVIWLHNVGSFNIILKHSTTSTAANQFITETSGDLVLGPNRIVQCTYDGTSAKWRAHGETYPYVFPTSDGTNGQVLVTNGSGALSWSTNGNASASGTTNYVAKFTGTTSLGDGIIFDNGTHVGIGTTTLNQIGGSRTLSINSNLDAAIELNANNTVYGVVYANTNGLGLSGFGAFGMRFYTASAIAGSAERMRIDASGNVGIGTTSPSSRFDVSTGTGANFRAAFAATNQVEIGNYSAASGYREIAVAGSQVYFQTNTAGSAGVSTRMLIDPSGNVGIGTTSPANQLHLHASEPRIQLTTTAGGSTYSDGAWIGMDATGLYLIERENSSIRFFVNSSTEAARIVASGRVGIGTTAPIEKLDVRSSSAFNAASANIAFFGSNEALASNPIGLAIQHVYSGARAFVSLVGTRYGLSGNDIEINGDSSGVGKALTVQYQGNVGIGTAAPGAKLQVDTLAAATKGLIVKGFTSQSATLQEWQNSSGTALATVSAAGTMILNPTRSTNPYFQIFPSGDSYNVFKIYSPSASWTGAGSSVVYEMPDSNNTITTSWAGTMTMSSTVPIVLKANNIYSNNPYVAVFATNTEVARFTQTGLLGVGTTSPGAMIQATTTAAATKGLIVRGFTSQSANLQEWQDSSSNILGYVSPTGSISSKFFEVKNQFVGQSGQPTITFTGAGNVPIALKVLDDSFGTLSFEGSAGQLFSINNNLASGVIFAVNDISGIPQIDVNADGTIRLAPFASNINVSGLTVGRGAGNVSSNTAFGSNALAANTTGIQNTAIGFEAAAQTTTGADIVAIGWRALKNPTAANSSTAVGCNALAAVTTATDNTAVGRYAGYQLTTGGANTIVGGAMYAATTAFYNVAIGHQTLNALVSGTYNTAVGYQAAIGITGQYNACFGFQVASGVTSGGYNTVVGSLALPGANGSNNVVIGGLAAQFQADGSTSLTATSNSVYVGYQTRGFSNSDSNSIVIGYQAIGKGANTTVLGNTSATQAWIYGTGIIYNYSNSDNYNENLRLPESGSGYSVIHMGGAAATSGTGNNQWALLKAGAALSHRFEIRHNTTAVVSILTDGSVGIGTTSQTSKFQVNNSGSTGSPFYVDAGNPAGTTTLFAHTGANTPVPFRLTKSGAAGSGSYGLLDLFYDTNTAGHGSNLYFSLDDSAGNITEYGGIGARINANTNGSERGDLYFYTMNTGTGRAEQMVLRYDGNLGIGTTNPTAKLQVNQATAGTIGLQVSMPTGAETTQAGIRVFGYSPAIELMDKDSIQNWYMGIDDNDSNKLLFGRGYGPGQGVTQAMTIDVSDNVGIGTTAPGNRLHVDGGANLPIRTVSSTFSGMECHITNGTWKAFIGTESGGGGNRYNSADNQHTFYNNSTAVMRINSSGYVGIGTTGPTKSLTIAQNGSAPGVLIYKSPDGTLNASQLTAALGSGSSFTNSGTSGGNEYGICALYHNGTTRVQLYAYDVGVGSVINFALDAFSFGTTTSFAQVGVVAKSASTPVIISRGFTSQTAPLMTYQDSSANALGYIAANGLDSSTFNDYTWTPNYAGGVNSPSTATYRKSSGNSNVWDGHVYSSEGFAKNVHVTFKVSQTNAYLMVGLNSDPATDANYSSLDYAWYPRNDGILEIYESNVSIGTFGAYTTSTVLTVAYDGTNVIYLKDGTIMRTVARAVGNLLYLDSSFYTLNGAVDSVRYGPTNIDLGSFSARMVSTYNTATGLSTFSVPKTLIGNIHFANGSGTNTSTRYQAALTFMGSSASESQAGIYVTNDNSTGTHMGFATTDSYATGPQLGMTISNTGAISFPRAATINTPATCSIGSTGNNGGVLSLGASYFGLRITSLNGDIINGNVNTVNITPGAGGNTTGLNVTGNMGASGIVAGFTNVGSASSKVMVVKGQTSQSGNLQEWQNSGGTSLASVGPAGDFSVPNLTSTNALVANSVATPRYYSYSVNAGNAVRLGQWNVTEGNVALYIQVSSDTGSHSGTSSYLYQGGFNVISNTSGQYIKLLPLMIGRGHGDGPDNSISSDSGGWTVFLYTGTTNPAYTMGVAVGVPTGKANKALRITVTELRGGMTYTADGSSISYPTTSYPYTLQHNYGNISSVGAIAASSYLYSNDIRQDYVREVITVRTLPNVVGDYIEICNYAENCDYYEFYLMGYQPAYQHVIKIYKFAATFATQSGTLQPCFITPYSVTVSDFELEVIRSSPYDGRFRLRRTKGTSTHNVYIKIKYFGPSSLTLYSGNGTSSGLGGYTTLNQYFPTSISPPPPSGGTGNGNSITISAASGVSSGSGGSVILQPGNAAGTNAPGAIAFGFGSEVNTAQVGYIGHGITRDHYFTRTMPTAAGDYVEICEILDSWPGIIEMTIMTYQHAAEGGAIKQYRFSPQDYYFSGGTIQPTMVVGANGWELEKFQNGATPTQTRLRIRRTIAISASPTCDAWIHMRFIGYNLPVWSYSGTGASAITNTLGLTIPATSIKPPAPLANNGAGRDLTVSAGNAAGTGAGGNLYLQATNGSTTGAGGSIILQTGAQATSGGDGQIIVRKSGTSDIGAIFPITNHSVGIQHGSGGTIGYVEIARQGFNGTNYLRLASHTTEGAFASGGSAIFSNQAISLVPGGSGASDSDVPVAIYRRPLLFTYSNFTTTNFGAGLKGSLSNGVIRVCDGTGTTVDSGNGGSFAYKSSTTNISTATNDLVLNGSAFQRLNCTTACNLTGVAPPTGGTHVDGRILRIVNTGTANLTLVHNSASSATANRFFNVAGANLVIAPNDYAELMYDATDNGRATSSPGWRVY